MNFPWQRKGALPFLARQIPVPEKCSGKPTPQDGFVSMTHRHVCLRRQRQDRLQDSQGNEKEKTMANALGYVSETKTGFEGTLAMMNLSAPIRILKNTEKEMDGQPDYRIFAGETLTEIGGGWLRKAKSSGRQYVSITLSDPQIGPRKVYANLAPVKGKKGRHVLLWNAS